MHPILQEKTFPSSKRCRPTKRLSSMETSRLGQIILWWILRTTMLVSIIPHLKTRLMSKLERERVHIQRVNPSMSQVLRVRVVPSLSPTMVQPVLVLVRVTYSQLVQTKTLPSPQTEQALSVSRQLPPIHPVKPLTFGFKGIQKLQGTLRSMKFLEMVQVSSTWLELSGSLPRRTSISSITLGQGRGRLVLVKPHQITSWIF